MAAVAARRKSNVGVAISATRVVAWLSRDAGATSGEQWEQVIAPMPPTASEWPELEVALRALAADSGGGSLFIALLPPLVQVRSIQLPPVGEEDAVRLVSRGTAKYFVGAREPQVVSVQAREGGKGDATHVIASAAPARLVEAIRDAADGAGWKIARIIPAQSAWLTAADHVWAKSDALVDHGRVVIIDDDRTEVIFKRSGVADSFRHLRGTGSNGANLLELVATQGPTAPTGASRNGLRPVAIIGGEAIRRGLAPAMRERGLQPLEPEGFYASMMNSAPLAAAHFAPLTEDLEMVTDQARTSREQKRHKLAAVLGAVAAVIFLGGLGTQYWGLTNEAALLKVRRDSVRTEVAKVLDAQSKIGSLGAPIAGLDSLKAQSVKWSVILSDIAQQLPSDAFIVSVRARDDSVNFSGKARDAGEALEALRRSPSLQDVRGAGQIRRDLDTATFDVVARIRRERGGNGQ